MNKYFLLGNYVNYFVREIVSPLSKVIEKRLFSDVWLSDDAQVNERPVFIMGVPRSGTTIAYQLLTSELNVSYISNYVEKHYYRPLSAFRFYLKNNPLIGHGAFESKFGKVAKSNPWAPNQGVDFLYNWMPSFKHAHNLIDFSEKQLVDLKRIIQSLLVLSGKNVVFKELSLSQKIPVLSTLFPSAKFIIINRDLSEVACSILRAMEDQNIDEGVMWGAQYEGFEKALSLPRKKMVAHQVVELKRNMYQGLSSVSNENIIEFDYKDICSDPETFVKKCSLFIGSNLIDESKELKAFIKLHSYKDPLYEELKCLVDGVYKR